LIAQPQLGIAAGYTMFGYRGQNAAICNSQLIRASILCYVGSAANKRHVSHNRLHPRHLTSGPRGKTPAGCDAAELLREYASVVDPFDIDALHTCMSRLAALVPPSGEEMRRAARESVAGLSLGAMAQQLLTLYRSLRPQRSPNTNS